MFSGRRSPMLILRSDIAANGFFPEYSGLDYAMSFL
jgi:hypothetical protein